MQTSDNICYTIWNNKTNTFFNDFDEEGKIIWDKGQFAGFPTAEIAAGILSVLDPSDQAVCIIQPMIRKEYPPDVIVILTFVFPNNKVKMYLAEDTTFTLDRQLAHHFPPEKEVEVTGYIESFLQNKPKFLSMVASNCRNITIEAKEVQ